MVSLQDRISFFFNKICESLNVPTFESFKTKSDKRLHKQKYKKLAAEVAKAGQKDQHLREIERNAKKNMSKVLGQIETLGNGLSQGFNLVSKEKLKNAKSFYNEYRTNAPLNKGEDDTLEIMFNCLKNDAHLTQYLDKKYQDEIGTGKPNYRNLSYGARRQLHNVRFKTKQLFILYKKFIEAQIELLSFADEIACISDGTVVLPPGAFQGTKSFNGALQKVTIRERSSDIGDLKDCARATIIFKTTADLVRAKNKVVESPAFKAVQDYQKALKDRYDSGTGKLEKFNVGAALLLNSEGRYVCPIVFDS